MIKGEYPSTNNADYRPSLKRLAVYLALSTGLFFALIEVINSAQGRDILEFIITFFFISLAYLLAPITIFLFAIFILGKIGVPVHMIAAIFVFAFAALVLNSLGLL